MKSLIVALAVAGCVRLPHVDPQARSYESTDRTVVRVQSSCSEEDPGGGQFPIQWVPDHTGTGVVVSERHVITAAHVVFCPIIPTVKVTFPDGRWYMMDVEKDDAMFGQGTDYARLVIASAEYFNLGIAPPKIGHALVGDFVELSAFDGERFGYYEGDDLFELNTHPGDSGAPIYNMGGELLGIVSKGSMDRLDTQEERATPRWLEGL